MKISELQTAGSLKFFFLCLIFLIITNFSFSQTILEGLFYLDHSPVRVEIKDGKIEKLTRVDKIAKENENIYISPGLIDHQINGYKGISFVDSNEELTPKGIEIITKSLWEAGVTSYFPTLTTNEHRIFLKNFAMLANSMEDPSLLGSIAGLHLEGPYISPVDGYRGAHPLKYVRPPDWEEFMELYNASRGNIVEVTLAPEVEGAMEFISKCQDLGIIVALGHHNGSAEQIKEAIDRGARIATHLGNGLANTINRHKNPLWPQLSDDRYMISIICDGFHLQPEQIRVFYKVKGPSKTILTSDVSFLGGLPPGFYLNAIKDTLELTPQGSVIYPAQQVLSGSGVAVTQGVGNILKFTGCSLGEAIQTASTNPARLFKLGDRGELKPGKRADIILFTLDDFKINIIKTIVNGVTVYEAPKITSFK